MSATVCHALPVLRQGVMPADSGVNHVSCQEIERVSINKSFVGDIQWKWHTGPDSNTAEI